VEVTVSVPVLLVAFAAILVCWYLLCRSVWKECDRVNREALEVLGAAMEYMDLAKEQAELTYQGAKEVCEEIRRLADDSRWN
jgi:hypothetical protein